MLTLPRGQGWIPPASSSHTIQELIDGFFAAADFDERLQDLPQQWQRPQVRPWPSIDWESIGPSQLVGMDPALFRAIVRGAVNTEAPIHRYAKTSRHFLAPVHAGMAAMVGGRNVAGRFQPGLWELEERRHTPALVKILEKFGEERIRMNPHPARRYRPSEDPRQDLFRHGLHRTATEYGAACLYGWLMTHSRGALQSVFSELLRDEINHLIKFLGFGLWAYPGLTLNHLAQSLCPGQWTYSPQRSSLAGTLHRMSGELAWADWTWTHRATFVWTGWSAAQRLWQWSQQQTPRSLRDLLGDPPL